MIDDILYDDTNSFILEKDTIVSGQISAYTLDSGTVLDFDYISTGGGEVFF